MNYNANSGNRPGPRKIKRVSDVNAMGMSAAPVAAAPQVQPFMNTQPQQYVEPTMGYGGGVQQPQQQQFNTSSVPTAGQFAYDPSHQFNSGYNHPSSTPSPPPNQMPMPGVAGVQQMPMQMQMPMQPQHQQQTQPPANQFAMFQQPIVQDMAMEYGQKLADQGKQLMESQFEKYIPITRLKYYFAVDNKYVINKLRLLLFPFTHSDWSLKYDQDNPVQPRYDINAPDLYIPTMAYITYVVLAGLVLGMQNRFSPEQLGILASSALAYSLFELIIYSITIYVANIPTKLKTLDLLAYSGYKFAIINICILISIAFHRIGYYSALIYCSISLGVFLLRALKGKIQSDSSTSTNDPTATLSYDAYGQPIANHPSVGSNYNAGKKRKLYFLFLVSGLQPLLSFWLSLHLIPSAITAGTTVPS